MLLAVCCRIAELRQTCRQDYSTEEILSIVARIAVPILVTVWLISSRIQGLPEITVGSC